jgi:sporulation protein YlmC with PRC-barrel domain
MVIAMKVSEIYNLDVYSDGGKYLGEVKDAIIDLQSGEVSRLLMEEWRNSSEEEVRKTLQHKSVLFKNVKNVGDVVLVSSAKQISGSEQISGTEAEDLSRQHRR